MKPRYQCNTCGEGTDPQMCGQWNCCKDHEFLTGEPVFAIERRYVSDYVADPADEEAIFAGALSLCCDATVAVIGEDLYCRQCDRLCWVNREEVNHGA